MNIAVVVQIWIIACVCVYVCVHWSRHECAPVFQAIMRKILRSLLLFSIVLCVVAVVCVCFSSRKLFGLWQSMEIIILNELSYTIKLHCFAICVCMVGWFICIFITSNGNFSECLYGREQQKYFKCYDEIIYLLLRYCRYNSKEWFRRQFIHCHLVIYIWCEWISINRRLMVDTII